MQRALTILHIVGVIGFWTWPLLCGIAWVFRGGIGGGPVLLSAVQGWLSFLAPLFAFIYYLCLVDKRWSKTLFVVGSVVHVALLSAIITLVAFTDAGFLVAPVLLVGPVAWLVYAIRVRTREC